MEGTGASPSPQGSGQAGNAPAAGGQPAPAPQGQAAPAARPDYIAEKFWDASANAPRVEDLAKSYNELAARFGKGKEAYRSEYEAERLKARPEKPDGYKAEISDGPLKQRLDKSGLVFLTEKPGADFKPEAGKQYFVLDNANPMLQFWREQAHANGYSNDQFMEGVARYVEFQHGQSQAQATQFQEAVKRDRAKLGETADQRVAHLRGQLHAVIGDEGLKAIDYDYLPSSAIQALESIMDKAGGVRFAPGNADPGPAVTEKDLRSIISDKDYWQNPEKQRQVAEGFKKLYPGTVNAALNPSSRVA